MQKVKIAFVDFWDNFDKEGFVCTQVLAKHCDVEIMADAAEADYVFFSVNGDTHWFLPPEKIKIFYTGEAVTPDFNACDYAIGFDWLTFGDRYLRLPNYYATPYYRHQTALFENRLATPLSEEQLRDLARNRAFCSFVVSNGKGHPLRYELFEALSAYRQVDSGGRWHNNVGGPIADKIAFESSHKFSLACENSRIPGYTTEKIIEAFAANTVPVYWGDPEIKRVFNPKAFIDVSDYPTTDALIKRIEALDHDEEAYISMLQEPPLLDRTHHSLASQTEEVERFMLRIIGQPLPQAMRRNRDFWGNRYNQREQELIIKSQKDWRSLLKERIIGKYPLFSKIGILNNL